MIDILKLQLFDSQTRLITKFLKGEPYIYLADERNSGRSYGVALCAIFNLLYLSTKTTAIISPHNLTNKIVADYMDRIVEEHQLNKEYFYKSRRGGDNIRISINDRECVFYNADEADKVRAYRPQHIFIDNADQCPQDAVDFILNGVHFAKNPQVIQTIEMPNEF